MAAVYAGMAFVLWQASSIAFPSLGLPSWSVTLIVVLTLAGFPVAVVLAWALEVTPEGVRHTKSVMEHPPGAEPGGPSPYAAGWVGAGILVGLVGVGAYAYWGEGNPTHPGSSSTLSSSRAVERSIAVLPFEDMSVSGDQAYLSDGLTEDLLIRLGQVSDLRVIGRESVMQYRDSDLGLVEIADELDVRYLLTGSVRRVGDEIRITARMLSGRGGDQIWAESYDRRLVDVFEVQAEVARRIAESLSLELTPDERRRLAREGTDSPLAYEFYLRGQAFYHRPDLNPGEFQQQRRSAATLFREALRADSGYAAAWAGLARAYLERLDMPMESARDSARRLSRRALRLDPEQAVARVTLGWIHFSEGETGAALEAFDRAVELRPNYAEAWAARGRLRLRMGRLDRAVHDFRQAAGLEPQDREIYVRLGWTYAYLDLLDRAERWLQKGLVEIGEWPTDARWHCAQGYLAAMRSDRPGVAARLDSALTSAAADESYAWTCAASLEIALGRFGAALEHERRFRRTLPEGTRDAEFLGLTKLLFLEATSGDSVRAHALRDQIERRVSPSPEADHWAEPLAMAYVHLFGGQADAALAALEDAIDRGYRHHLTFNGFVAPSLAEDPSFAALHDHPIFKRLARRVEEDVRRMRHRVLADEENR